jgi:hypothetical protein
MIKVGQTLANIYFWLLWYWGFTDTDGLLQTPGDREMITFMLRRSKERMGLAWWVVSLGTILGVFAVCVYVSWWYAFLEAFLLWLFVHVLYDYQPPDNIWKGE